MVDARLRLAARGRDGGARLFLNRTPLDGDPYRKLLDEIGGITPPVLTDVAERYLQTERLHYAVVCEPALLAPLRKRFGNPEVWQVE